MSYEPLHHKYRPQTFSDLVGQDAIATTLRNAIRTSKIAPAYLFTGSRGTGKTSSARILAKSLNCLKSDKPTEQPCGVCEVCKGIANGSALDVVEIDAASNTGVENIRDLIERAQFAPVQCRFKVYIIDEVHMLSTAAFNALLKTLEEPPELVVFVLATTDPQRVLPTIISRCQRFDFRRIAIDAMVKHLRKIAFKENINIIPEAVQLVAQVSQGGLRDAESLLDQLSLLSGQVTVERVWDLVGSCSEPDLIELLQAIAQNNAEAVLVCARTIMDRGREPLTVLQNVVGFYRDLLIAKTAPNRNDLVALTPPTWTKLCEEAKSWDTYTILAGQQHLAKSEVQIKNTTQPRLWLEVTLLGLLSLGHSSQQQAVKGETLEERLPINSQGLETANNKPFVSPGDHPTKPLPPADLPAPVNPAVANSVPPTQPTPPPDHAAPTSPPPSVQRENSEPSPSISQPTEVAAQQAELEQVWQQVINNIELEGTKSMLRIHSCLLAFNGQEAVIGSSGKGKLKLIQGTSPLIKKAFLKTFKADVTVSFQLVVPSEHKSALTEKPRSPDTGTVPDTSPQVAEPVTSHLAGTSSSQAPATTQFPAGMTAQGATAPDSQSPTMGVAHASTTSANESEDEVATAAQSLADYFKGEVISLNLDATFPDSTNTNSLPQIATPRFESQDADLCDGEADIDDF